MTLKDFAVKLITVFEGCKLTAYQDTGGVWTIGFGHTGPEVVKGFTITQERASSLLAEDASKLFALVSDKPLLEAAALVSFGYNCGLGALQKVLAGTSQLSQYVHDSKGNLLPGLKSRRDLEQALIDVSKG